MGRLGGGAAAPHRAAGRRRGQFGLANAGWFGSYAQLWQTDWVGPDLKTVVCDSPEMVECYSRFFELANRPRAAPPGELESALGVNTPVEASPPARPRPRWSPLRRPQFTEPKLVELALAPIPRAKVSVPDVTGTASA